MNVARRAAAEPQFPALRMGAHFGDALYREADYLGATVNTAARVAGQAGAGQLLVTAALRDAVGDTASVPMEHFGERPLKGVSAPVDLYAIALPRPTGEAVGDPVCGMTLDPAGVHVTATWRGTEYAFCSTACRDRFESDPRRYAAR